MTQPLIAQEYYEQIVNKFKKIQQLRFQLNI